MKHNKRVRKLILEGYDIFDFSKSDCITVLYRYNREMCVFKTVLENGCVLKGLVII